MTTTTPSAEDVRDLVEKLWARCPDCQPMALRYRQPKGCTSGWYLGTNGVLPSEATALILQKIAKSGTAVCDKVRSRRPGCYLDLTTAIMSGDLPGAVAGRHRLADVADTASAGASSSSP